MISEQELVERAKQGNKQAYESLYRLSVANIHALSLRMSCDASLAEDLTQEAFIVGWRKLASFQGNSRFTTWMYKICTNVVIDYLRVAAKWQMVNYDDLEELGVAQQHDKDVSFDLENAIKLLPDQARTVLILHEYLGYQHNEIAECTGLAVGTCKAHLHRARKLLKEVMA